MLPPAIFTQIGQAIFGISILLCIPFFFSPSDQSILFLFLSLGALSRLADMGFLNLVIIYSSKSSETQYKDYIPAFKIFTYKLHLKKLLTIFPLIFIIGYLLLVFSNDPKSYLGEWFLYVLAISSGFSVNYFLSFHEGAFDLKFAHIFRGLYFSLSGLFFFLFSYLGFSIISLGLSLIISSICIFIFLFYYGVLRLDFSTNCTLSLSNYEFSTLSHKAFVSWLGGYIGTHGLITASYLLINPFFSGLLGLTFNIFIFLQNLANIFLVSVVPEVSSLASTNTHRSLRIIMDSLRKSLITYVILVMIFFAFYLNLPTEYSERLLGVKNILFIAFAFLFSIVTYAFSIFVRAFKVEPFGVVALFTSFIAVATMTFTASFSWDFALAGFTLASFISFFYTYLIFLKHKKSYV